MSVVHPYRRPANDTIRPASWTLTRGETTVDLPLALPDWDYDTRLELHRTLVIDGGRVRKESGLGEDAVVAISVRWTATSSLLRGRAWKSELPAADDEDVAISFTLPGHDLGGALALETVVTLVSPGMGASRTAPRRPGSVLWSDRHTVELGGTGTNFPLAIADFGALPYPTDAPWILQIDGGNDYAALGSLLLLVNERRKTVVDVVTGQGRPDPGKAAAVMSALRSDTLRGLLERAVVDEEFTAETTYPDGSTGAVLQAVLREHFDDTDLETLRREYRQDPAYFIARVQAAAHLFEDEA